MPRTGLPPIKGISMSRCSSLAFLLIWFSFPGIGLSTLEVKAPKPAQLNASELEDRAFMAINHLRQSYGLAPLQRASDLNEVARAHSRDMMRRRYFSHTSPEGDDLRGRFARNGITQWRYIAENLAYNLGYADPAKTAVEGWMKSPAHRQNILNKRLTESGIGVAIDEMGRTYFTQVFATRDSRLMARVW